MSTQKIKIRKVKMDKWKETEAKLQVADIILVRRKKIFSRMIRKATGSYWSHVMIVFSVADKKINFKNILVVSAETRGIEIHRIQKFSRNLDGDYDFGVKRFPGLTAEDRQKVMSYMLNNVDIPYDYLRIFGFMLNYFLNLFKIKKRQKHIKKYLINKNTFICSSFIQKAFFAAVPKEKKEAVLFTKNKDFQLVLEEITPADIARSNNFEWIYNPHL